MQKLNILFAGNTDKIPLLINSKFVNKLYTTSNIQNSLVINIPYKNIEDLADKCSKVDIDLAIIDDEVFAEYDMVQIFKNKHINCLGLTKEWYEKFQNERSMKDLFYKYSINSPQILKYPKQFPLLIKAQNFSKIVYSFEEIMKNKLIISNEQIATNKSIYLEEFIDEEIENYNLVFDGKTTVIVDKINEDNKYKQNALEELLTKINKLLVNENANFIGIFSINVIFDKQKLYLLNFSDKWNYKSEKDILFIFIMTLYQKLNEV